MGENHFFGSNDSNVATLMEELNTTRVIMDEQKYHLENPLSTDETRDEISIDSIGELRSQLDAKFKEIEDAGYQVKLTKLEKKSLDFQENIANIKTMKLSISGYFGINNGAIAEVDDENVQIQYYISKNPIDPVVIDKEAFLEELSKIYVGEWQETYYAKDYGIQMMDGTKWQLLVTYDNQQPDFVVSGSNAYPYNFVELRKLLKVEGDQWL